MPDNFACQGEMFKGKNTAKTLSFGGEQGRSEDYPFGGGGGARQLFADKRAWPARG